MAFLMARTPLREQPWRYAAAQITGQASQIAVGSTAQFSLSAEGFDLNRSRIVWEATDTEPFVGPTFTVKPMRAGKTRIEAEATLPDGRRAFATREISVGAR